MHDLTPGVLPACIRTVSLIQLTALRTELIQLTALWMGVIQLTALWTKKGFYETGWPDGAS